MSRQFLTDEVSKEVEALRRQVNELNHRFQVEPLSAAEQLKQLLSLRLQCISRAKQSAQALNGLRETVYSVQYSQTYPLVATAGVASYPDEPASLFRPSAIYHEIGQMDELSGLFSALYAAPKTFAALAELLPGRRDELYALVLRHFASQCFSVAQESSGLEAGQSSSFQEVNQQKLESWEQISKSQAQTAISDIETPQFQTDHALGQFFVSQSLLQSSYASFLMYTLSLILQHTKTPDFWRDDRFRSLGGSLCALPAVRRWARWHFQSIFQQQFNQKTDDLCEAMFFPGFAAGALGSFQQLNKLVFRQFQRALRALPAALDNVVCCVAGAVEFYFREKFAREVTDATEAVLEGFKCFLAQQVTACKTALPLYALAYAIRNPYFSGMLGSDQFEIRGSRVLCSNMCLAADLALEAVLSGCEKGGLGAWYGGKGQSEDLGLPMQRGALSEAVSPQAQSAAFSAHAILTSPQNSFFKSQGGIDAEGSSMQFNAVVAELAKNPQLWGNFSENLSVLIGEMQRYAAEHPVIVGKTTKGADDIFNVRSGEILLTNTRETFAGGIFIIQSELLADIASVIGQKQHELENLLGDCDAFLVDEMSSLCFESQLSGDQGLAWSSKIAQKLLSDELKTLSFAGCAFQQQSSSATLRFRLVDEAKATVRLLNYLTALDSDLFSKCFDKVNYHQYGILFTVNGAITSKLVAAYKSAASDVQSSEYAEYQRFRTFVQAVQQCAKEMQRLQQQFEELALNLSDNYVEELSNVQQRLTELSDRVQTMLGSQHEFDRQNAFQEYFKRLVNQFEAYLLLNKSTEPPLVELPGNEDDTLDALDTEHQYSLKQLVYEDLWRLPRQQSDVQPQGLMQQVFPEFHVAYRVFSQTLAQMFK